MNCAEVLRLIHELLDGDLPPAAERRLSAHLEECTGACRYHYLTIRATVRLHHANQPYVLRPTLLETILHAIEKEP